MRIARRLLLISAVIVTLSATTWAGSMYTLANGSEIFSSGMDGSGSPAAPCSTDTHWVFTLNPSTGTPAYVCSHTAWAANDADSQWLTPVLGSTNEALRDNTAPGQYMVATEVDLTGMDLATVAISGFWASDNGGLDILINGNSISPTTLPGPTSFQSQPATPFTLDHTSGYLASGINVFEFKWDNAPNQNTNGYNPAGVRIEFTSAVGDLGVPIQGAVPLPTALWPALVLLAGLGIRRRARARD